MEPDALPRVLAMTWGSGDQQKDAVNMIFMEPDGRVKKTLKVNNLRAAEHMEEFLEFAEACKPDVIAIAGLHAVATRRLLEHTNAAVVEGRAKGSLSFNPKIIVVNDEVARLYYNSKRAVEEFRSMPPLMRYCVALARRLQSPVHEYAALGKDILHIKHHPQQNLSGPMELRTELASNKLMGRSVFMNCASFLRIRPFVQILDDTRIHPADYNLAKKIAAGALDVDPEDLDDEHMARLVLRLTKGDEAEKLDSLDLDAYADRLEKETGSRKRMLLIHIRHELRAPYKDARLAYPDPTLDETFTLVTGETDRTLRPGSMIPVVITKVRDRSASARLDNGLDGFIPIQRMSDRPVDRASDVLQVGQTIHCQIVNVDKARYLVELSCKPSEVHSGDPISMTQRDKYFDEFVEEQMMNAEGECLFCKNHFREELSPGETTFLFSVSERQSF
ncbi:MAG: Holliday-junction resolvase-like of SPT6-domain-containing protein [Olpidium bornovanus]|uniref:Holliday-junction resolvase-like of SPT6-domain-containing protein n=1 Tax=Olpidium bornovanus TaxID=278681 RepID=A0A8H7ZW30_9FUNG|nr:MAG: Holliday-junction resolvase-like of SPT6-domain-containing protein [Olpidium bornovanus]